MRKSYLFAGWSVFAGLLGCGDDSGSNDNGSSSLATLCARVCVRANAPACTGDVPAQCMSNCTSQAQSAPSACTAQVSAVLTCASKAAFTCDSNKEAQPTGCDSQQTALATCVTANPASTTGGAGNTATGKDAGAVAASDAGSTQSHRDAGGPVASDAASQAFSDAGTASQAAVCAPALDDDACTTCGKSKCCNVLSACVTDTSCRTLGACVSNCASTDDACFAACEDASTTAAIDQFLSVGDCYDAMCATQCN